MNYVIAGVLCGSFLLGGCFAEDELVMSTGRIADKLTQNIKDLESKASISIGRKDKECLVVQWNVREHQVYTGTKTGEWTNALTTITGPSDTGCRLEVSFGPGDYKGQLERGKGPTLSVKSAFREPNFFASYSLLNLKNAHAQVNIHFGGGADFKLIKKVYDEIVQVAKQEIGESDNIDVRK